MTVTGALERSNKIICVCARVGKGVIIKSGDYGFPATNDPALMYPDFSSSLAESVFQNYNYEELRRTYP